MLSQESVVVEFTLHYLRGTALALDGVASVCKARTSVCHVKEHLAIKLVVQFHDCWAPPMGTTESCVVQAGHWCTSTAPAHR